MRQAKRVFSIGLWLFVISMQLTGCSSMGSAMDKVKNIDLWPFDNQASGEQTRTYRPANASEYQCDKNKKFFVRMLDKGETVWLITKEREIALPKVGLGEYRKENIRLVISKESAELSLSADIPYTNCKLMPMK
jgi:hypothetical protein